VYDVFQEVIMDRKLVKSELKRRGIKHKWFAETIGIHPSTLSAYLTGRKTLSLAIEKSIFRELNLNTEALGDRAS
jgi:plasmid maintenance system antidote protein VapI